MHAGVSFIDELIGLLMGLTTSLRRCCCNQWVLPQIEFHKLFEKNCLKAGYGERIMYGSDEMILGLRSILKFSGWQYLRASELSKRLKNKRKISVIQTLQGSLD